MKQLNITSQSKSKVQLFNRWIDMKEQLMQLHEAKWKERYEEDSASFKTMGEKIQGIDESVSQFGKSLVEMAQKLLKIRKHSNIKKHIASTIHLWVKE